MPGGPQHLSCLFERARNIGFDGGNIALSKQRECYLPHSIRLDAGVPDS